MVTATFRFYQELNDFLPPARRQREFDVPCAQAATAKHMIEALGVPHTEVELILVNGESVGFERRLRDQDRVAVYPKFEALDVTPLLRVREQPLRTPRFVADAHLGHGLGEPLRPQDVGGVVGVLPVVPGRTGHTQVGDADGAGDMGPTVGRGAVAVHDADGGVAQPLRQPLGLRQELGVGKTGIDHSLRYRKIATRQAAFSTR